MKKKLLVFAFTILALCASACGSAAVTATPAPSETPTIPNISPCDGQPRLPSQDFTLFEGKGVYSGHWGDLVFQGTTYCFDNEATIAHLISLEWGQDGSPYYSWGWPIDEAGTIQKYDETEWILITAGADGHQ